MGDNVIIVDDVIATGEPLPCLPVSIRSLAVNFPSQVGPLRPRETSLPKLGGRLSNISLLLRRTPSKAGRNSMHQLTH